MRLTIRRPDVDLRKGFTRHWFGGNGAVTHAFNALSWMFPQGEKFFIDIAAEAAKAAELKGHPRYAAQIDAFVAQEQTHRHQHGLYNEALVRQGFTNSVAAMIERLDQYSRKHFSLLTNLGVVTAYEHYTAVLGDFLLSDTALFEAAEKEVALIWGWHAVEETEHKSVCFDLYQASGGGWLRRILTFLLVTLSFTTLFVRSYTVLLYQDGALHPSRIFKTAKEAIPFFWGRKGLSWSLIFKGMKYLSPRFHPWNDDNSLYAEKWLEQNRAHLIIVK